MALKDTWVDLEDAIAGMPDSGDEVSAEPINNIAHSVIAIEKLLAQGEIAGKSPYIGENGNWYVWDSETNQYEDSGVQARGEVGASGLPTVRYYSNTELQFHDSLRANEEVRITSPAHSVIIDSFLPFDEMGFAESWSISFTATNNPEGEPPTVTLPTSVEWAVAEPVFTAGYTYYLSFIPFGEKILGVWVAKELTE